MSGERNRQIEDRARAARGFRTSPTSTCSASARCSRTGSSAASCPRTPSSTPSSRHRRSVRRSAGPSRAQRGRRVFSVRNLGARCMGSLRSTPMPRSCSCASGSGRPKPRSAGGHAFVAKSRQEWAVLSRHQLRPVQACVRRAPPPWARSDRTAQVFRRTSPVRLTGSCWYRQDRRRSANPSRACSGADWRSPPARTARRAWLPRSRSGPRTNGCSASAPRGCPWVTGSGRTPARLHAFTELRLGEARPFAVEFLHGVE